MFIKQNKQIGNEPDVGAFHANLPHVVNIDNQQYHFNITLGSPILWGLSLDDKYRR
jgi:hypothetical protein